MENKYDFRVNDPVYDLMFGNGFITKINKKIITVYYENNLEDISPEDSFYGLYNLKGEMQEIGNPEIDSFEFGIFTKRTLFHGHNLQINVRLKSPIRNKWVNVYIDEKGNPFFGKVLDNKKHLDAERLTTYVTTIELKPKR
jgi:hypothetical protein